MAVEQSQSPFLLVPEVSAVLRTPEPTLRHWRRVGYGPSWAKLRGRVVYPRVAVEQFRDALLDEATSRTPTR